MFKRHRKLKRIYIVQEVRAGEIEGVYSTLKEAMKYVLPLHSVVRSYKLDGEFGDD